MTNVYKSSMNKILLMKNFIYQNYNEQRPRIIMNRDTDIILNMLKNNKSININ